MKVKELLEINLRKRVSCYTSDEFYLRKYNDQLIAYEQSKFGVLFLINGYRNYFCYVGIQSEVLNGAWNFKNIKRIPFGSSSFKQYHPLNWENIKIVDEYKWNEFKQKEILSKLE